MGKIKLLNRSEGEPFKKEMMKVGKNNIHIKVNLISGKDGDFWLVISPSLNVSGYGNTKEEAQESFNENVELFVSDLYELGQSKRLEVLKKMGWQQGGFFKKRLSKLFVDENGVLQNLEHAQIVSNSLESVM